jgi:hypothetical protein
MLLAKDGQVAGVQDAIIDVVRFISGGSEIVAVQSDIIAGAGVLARGCPLQNVRSQLIV